MFADNAHKNFSRGNVGDHIALMNCFEGWAESNFSTQWCYENYVQVGVRERERCVCVCVCERERECVCGCGWECVRVCEWCPSCSEQRVALTSHTATHLSPLCIFAVYLSYDISSVYFYISCVSYLCCVSTHRSVP